jgi:hypothetical protein
VADWVEYYALARMKTKDCGVAPGLVVAEDFDEVVHAQSARVQMSKKQY